MPTQTWLAAIVLTGSLLTACGAPAAPTPAAVQVSAPETQLDTSYADALSARNQLALGTLNLADTSEVVTPDQATALLPLWQALRATSQSGGGSQTEVAALLAQIESTLTADQIAAIEAQTLTQADLQTWAQANGVALGAGTAGNGEPGSGQGLSPEARATRQAEQGRTAGNAGGASTALIDAVTAYLTTLIDG
ncbi:MAG TPA: hypothetical protein PK954_09940 [Anaerolineales bacterium]|nr:hypothetical protein [Anaerolineales bacterium]HRF48362.1 hypothetical protein [Anaerolineales bacterium]